MGLTYDRKRVASHGDAEATIARNVVAYNEGFRRISVKVPSDDELTGQELRSCTSPTYSSSDAAHDA